MSIFLAIVDLLKAAVWLIAVAFIAIWYKGDIRDILPRLRKAGPTGIELDAAIQQRVAVSTVSTSVTLKDLPGFPRTEAMATVETELHQSLKLIETELQIDMLIRQLAVARLSTVFERIYSLLFGSQIVGLRRPAHSNKASLEEAKDFFEPYRRQYEEFSRIMALRVG